MLSLFPQLFDYSFFAPFFLRIGVGMVLLTLAYRVSFSHNTVTKTLLSRFSFLRPTSFWIGLGSLITLVIACLVIVGLYTQIAAILIILAGLKLATLRTFFGADYGIDNTTAWLLVIIGLTLLVAGPGAFAIDLPL